MSKYKVLVPTELTLSGYDEKNFITYSHHHNVAMETLNLIEVLLDKGVLTLDDATKILQGHEVIVKEGI